jgi:glycosyltransferase involved in cell wall biosynthesis
MRILQIGASPAPVCGVRDYAKVLDEILRGEAATAGCVWWDRHGPESVREGVTGAREWLARVTTAVHTAAPDWLLWHYVPNTYGRRGLPFLVPKVAGDLRRTGVPVTVVLHEVTASWKGRGVRGFGQALAHRLALVPVLGLCTAVVVTTEGRAEWLQGRPWLRRRPVMLAPVFSCIPVDGAGTRDRDRDWKASPSTVGVFGYGGFGPEEVLVDVIVEAMALLARQGLEARLVLLGSPGPTSAAATRWRQASASAGLEAPEFTGVLDPATLSRTIGRMDVMILPDRSGPTSRKGTLAASLGNAAPIVAFAAPTAWRQLVDEQAVRLAPPVGDGLAKCLAELLRNDDLRMALGRRAGEFYRANVRPQLMARRLLEFLAETEALSGRAVGAAPRTSRA